MIEISYRDTIGHAYYDFNLGFFKIFVIHMNLGKFEPKI